MSRAALELAPKVGGGGVMRGLSGCIYWNQHRAKRAREISP
jgi:hypothetical protein